MLSRIIVVMTLSLLLFGCDSGEKVATGTVGKTKVDIENNKRDRASYALGLQISEAYSRQDFDFNPDAMAIGLRDGLPGGTPKMSESQVMETMMEVQTEMMSKMEGKQKRDGANNLEEGSKFLEENKKRKGVTELPSGLQYEVMTMGKGAKPSASSTVTVHYKGTLVNGKVFDSSYDRGDPATFPLQGVIPGWTEALQLMPIGSKWKLFLPPHLAYGEQSAGPDIGPNSTLIFEVELLSIKE